MRNGVLAGVQASGQREVGVDGGGIQVVQRAGQLGGIHFDELDLLGVLNDVQRRGLEAGFGLELDQALVLEHQQHTAAIGGVVGDADAGAFLQILQVFDLLRIDADGEVDRVAHGHDLVATVFHLGIEVGLVLVAIAIQVAGGQCGVGLHVVGELDDLDLQAVLLGNLLHLFKNLGVRAASHADLDGLVLGQGGHRQSGSEGQCQGGLQKGTLVHGSPWNGLRWMHFKG